MNFIDTILSQIPALAEHLEAMKQTQQDPEWHGERDVYTHTLMVLAEVEKLNLPERDKDLLRYVAVLHDIGKPKTTTLEDGRLRSHGHSRLGYHLALELLDATSLNFDTIFQIINLIKYHGEPTWLFEKENPDREVIKMSTNCRLDLLYHFVTCDFKGRIADDIPESLLKLEYFKDVAQSLNCLDQPYAFPSALTRFNYLHRRSHHHTDVVYDVTKSRVYMMCGLPGTGKDTYIAQHLNSMPVISLDAIRKELKIKATDEQGLVIQTAKDRAKEYLRQGQDFVWNATNTGKQIREGLIQLFDTYDAYIIIYYLHNRVEKILTQNRQREAVVPEAVIRKLHRKLEIPLPSEAHQVIYIS